MPLDMLKKANEIKSQLVEWRRMIHSQPELGFDVYQTAGLVARELTRLGLKVQTGIGKTGVIGTLGSGSSPVIAIRADMDALPIQELNDVPYASQVPDRMHACGHDAHTSMLLGIACLLNEKDLPGQVRFLFQPSEETCDDQGESGATLMIADGAMEDVDAVIALHVDAELDLGKIEVSEGYSAASTDTFIAQVIGQGGHGAHPHDSIDPIWITSHVLNVLYAIPSRRIGPLHPSVVTVGAIQGGSTENVIPDNVTLKGTLRSVDDQVREQLIQEVEMALSVSRALGGDYSLEIVRGSPPIYNDPVVVNVLRQVGIEMLGKQNIDPGQLGMGGEDFAFMTKKARGAMFSLGVKTPGGEARLTHTPYFDIEEDALPIGTAMLAETALRLLTSDF